MKENTPPSKASRRVSGLSSPINETPEREATGTQLLAENKGLKRKLLEYEKDNNDLRQKVALMETNPYYLGFINLAKNANLPLDDVTLPPGTTPPVDLSSFTDRRNPFRNDLILPEVFRYLGSEDLIRCRLVNRQWNYYSTPYFRNAHPYIGFASVQQVTKFVRTAGNSTSFPFSRFFIQNRFVSGMAIQFGLFAQRIKDLRLSSTSTNASGDKHSINLHSVLEILKTMTNLKKLELTNLSFPEVFPDTLRELTFTIPFLQSLRIEANFLEIEGLRLGQWMALFENPKSHQIVRHIFHISPSLKRVSLEIPCKPCYTKMFLEVLALLPSLEELEVTSRLTESNLLPLMNTPKPFALKSLQLTLLLETWQILVRFLEAHACTLETLELHLNEYYGYIRTHTSGLEFPNIPNLRNLKLISSLFELPFPFRRIPGGGEFPSLSKLHITDDVYQAFFWSKILNCINVEDLTLTNTHDTRIRCSFHEIECVFPNVKKISLISSNAEDLHGVVVKFPNLEFLQFGPIRNITENLTGIPQLPWIESGLPVNPVAKYFAIDFLQRTGADLGGGLHLLKNLKRLEIKGQADGISGIKDTLGYGVLLALPRLEYLVITNSELSESCIDELRKHHHNVIFK